MRRFVLTAAIMAISTIMAIAQSVTVNSINRPAEEVFKELMTQSGKNFVYSSDILSGLRVSISAKNKPLKKVLNQMFKGTDIEFKIVNNNVMLKRRKQSATDIEIRTAPKLTINNNDSIKAKILDEVMVVESRLEAPAVETSEVGAKKLTAEEISNTPVMLGEADVVKALHMQPGITEGAEGMAGMHVHGGGNDENMYMLDNVPLYHMNHFAGLFSAFNIDAIRYIDFFKSSIPAKYDGRLSSFLDVRTKNGNPYGHQGTAKLGLTSGAFSLNGPVSKNTTYSLAIRRSWYDVLTTPLISLINAASDDEKIRFGYAFMDVNAKLHHRFSHRTSGYLSIYYGNDRLTSGDKSDGNYGYGYYYDDKYRFNWGNFVAQTGVMHRPTDLLRSEFTLAYTCFFSGLKKDESYTDKYEDEVISYTRSKMTTTNNINDLIGRADWYWQPNENANVRFGASYTLHSFLPARTFRESIADDVKTTSRDSTWRYLGSEINTYIENDWCITDRLRANPGLHMSLFRIDGKTNYGVSPRLSLSYRIDNNWALKGAYSRTVQYVHQLTQSYLSLPTDQWIPITGNFKPQTADKIAIGGYWESTNRHFAAYAEGYYKKMNHLIEYRDEYYLHPPLEMWNARLTSGDGTSKGVDLKFEKTSGKLTGHVAYSLAWADRTFAEKNGGKTYPARFDNRHTINILLNWKMNQKVTLNAAWTGHSGSHFTFLPQSWETPEFGITYGIDRAPLQAPVNNYQLPFYHRLDIGVTVANSRGFWNFGLYNAYCHRNTIVIRRSWHDTYIIEPNGVVQKSKPVFQKVSLFPIIPSISYTWQF